MIRLVKPRVQDTSHKWDSFHKMKARDQFNETDPMRCQPIEVVRENSLLLVEQKEWSLRMYLTGMFKGDHAYTEFMKYFGASVVLMKPSWATAKVHRIRTA